MERFDPAKHQPDPYVNQSPAYCEQKRLAGFVLNSLFTHMTRRADQRIQKMSNTSIPLYGSLPFKEEHRYHDQLFPTIGQQDNEILYLHDSYISTTFELNGVAGVKTSVGEYGDRFAFAIIQAARAVMGLFEESSKDSPYPYATPPEYREIVEKFTFQKDILQTLHEGVQTLAGITGMITAKKVKGYERNPIKLYDHIQQQGIFNAIATMATPGHIAELIRDNQAIVEPLSNTHGKIKLTPCAHKAFASAPNDPGHAGCPAGRANTPILNEQGERQIIKPTAIDTIAILYGKYLAHYYSIQKTEKDRQKVVKNDYIPLLK